jgi:hypothetical protein
MTLHQDAQHSDTCRWRLAVMQSCCRRKCGVSAAALLETCTATRLSRTQHTLQHLRAGTALDQLPQLPLLMPPESRVA